MYAVFLLRALGYSDTADFSYANAIETAREQGIYDTGIINVQNFLRDDAAAASYTDVYKRQEQNNSRDQHNYKCVHVFSSLS